jgi:hypothetical protein
MRFGRVLSLLADVPLFYGSAILGSSLSISVEDGTAAPDLHLGRMVGRWDSRHFRDGVHLS